VCTLPCALVLADPVPDQVAPIVGHHAPPPARHTSISRRTTSPNVTRRRSRRARSVRSTANQGPRRGPATPLFCRSAPCTDLPLRSGAQISRKPRTTHVAVQGYGTQSIGPPRQIGGFDQWRDGTNAAGQPRSLACPTPEPPGPARARSARPCGQTPAGPGEPGVARRVPDRADDAYAGPTFG
jgi:hypothetical protein